VLIPESDALLCRRVFPQRMLGEIVPQTPASRMAIRSRSPDCNYARDRSLGGDLTGLGRAARTYGPGCREAETRAAGPSPLPVIQVAQAEHRGVISADDIDLFLTGKARAKTNPHGKGIDFRRRT